MKGGKRYTVFTHTHTQTAANLDINLAAFRGSSERLCQNVILINLAGFWPAGAVASFRATDINERETHMVSRTVREWLARFGKCNPIFVRLIQFIYFIN